MTTNSARIVRRGVVVTPTGPEDGPRIRPIASRRMIIGALIASALLIFVTPARRFLNRTGVSPIRQQTCWQRKWVSSKKEFSLAIERGRGRSRRASPRDSIEMCRCCPDW